jgi:cytochrome c oxidase cbb3-type subunit 3
MKKKEDELLDSDYDGIQEYDNNLPRWWVQLFYATVIFGIGYVAYYHILGIGDLPHVALEKQMVKLRALKEEKELVKENSTATNVASLEKLLTDPTTIATGKEVFIAKCVACHGNNGEGLVGPNLTDDYWIHGATPADVYRVIAEGVLEKGMLAWKGMVSDDELNAVTAYVWSIHGTNPPNPKEPQGDLHPRS